MSLEVKQLGGQKEDIQLLGNCFIKQCNQNLVLASHNPSPNQPLKQRILGKRIRKKFQLKLAAFHQTKLSRKYRASFVKYYPMSRSRGRKLTVSKK